MVCRQFGYSVTTPAVGDGLGETPPTKHTLARNGGKAAVTHKHLVQASIAALIIALSMETARAQTSLPTIEVGRRPVTRTASASRTPTTVRIPSGPAPRVSPVVRTAAPAPAPPPARSPLQLPQQAASQQSFTGAQVNAVPFERPGQALEVVPGLLVSQHSGEGKTNQYNLRGFQLDHGTDLAIWIDEMPINMRTHGHGQGWADANFFIPELFASVNAKKGVYYADEGDFSSAGSVHVQYVDKLDKDIFVMTGGSFGYGRVLAAKSAEVNGGSLLSAVELGTYNGPWVRPDEMHKINAVMRWSRGTPLDGLSLTGMAYANRWYSTDQIASRAVYGGFIPLNGYLDRTDGGDTTRFSLSGTWSQTEGNHASRIEAYAIHSTLDLYNDFDYFLTNPVLGDQFHQFDKRTILGFQATHGVKYFDIAGLPAETRVGLQGRYDDIRVGLQDSFHRTPYDTLSNDLVAESSLAFWTDTTVKWTPWLRSTTGFRVDLYHASVGNYQDPSAAPRDANGLPIWTGPWNSGVKSAAITSPKAAIVLGPYAQSEVFLNFGEGFHSTDARGTVGTLSPIDGSTLAPIPLLVKSRGAEIGARSKAIEGLDSSISFWWLNFDSENQYNGDTGTTVFGRPSRRYGIEITNHYTPASWVNFEGDVALVNARFRGVDQQQALTWLDLLQPASLPYLTFIGNAPGNFIPQAVGVVASATMEIGEKTGWFGAFKYRYVGAQGLTEDGAFKGPARGTVNIRAGYRWSDGWRLQADVFNLFNSRTDQMTYAYGSLLPTDPLFAQCVSGVAPANVCAIGVMDRHFHPFEPTALRVTLAGPLTFDTSIAHLPDLKEPFAKLPF